MPSSTGSFELSVSLGENSFSASGKHDLVLKAFEDFKALTGRSGDSTVPKGQGSTTRAKPGASGKVTSSSGGLPLPAYLSTLKLAGNKERATAILVWSTGDGQERLTTAEIKALWTKTHLKPASNLSRDLGEAVKKGWIVLEGKGQEQGWAAHGFGKKAVSEWVAAEKE
jgi:hypothetical protein